MKKMDSVVIDPRKKAWMYQNGVLPAMSWDFMVYKFTDRGIKEMEAITNRHLTKSADRSILYRKDKGLNIRSVRSACLAAQVNKEIILACSQDVNVRRVATRKEVKK